MIRRALVALLALFLSLCTSCAFHQARGPQFQEVSATKQGAATVYIYRTANEKSGYNRTYTLLANGEKVTDLLHGGYFPLEIEPGRLRLASDVNATIDRVLGLGLVGLAFEEAISPDAAKLAIDVKPGQTYFVKFKPEVHFTHFTPKLSLVDDPVGRSEIRSCSLLEPAK